LKTTDRRCSVAMETTGLYGTANPTTSRHLAGEKAAWHDLESLRDGDAVTSLICTDYGYRCPRMPGSLLIDMIGTFGCHGCDGVWAMPARLDGLQ
jgi:hypothetical protein